MKKIISFSATIILAVCISFLIFPKHITGLMIKSVTYWENIKSNNDTKEQLELIVKNVSNQEIKKLKIHSAANKSNKITQIPNVTFEKIYFYENKPLQDTYTYYFTAELEGIIQSFKCSFKNVYFAGNYSVEVVLGVNSQGKIYCKNSKR